MHPQEDPETRVFNGIRWESVVTMLKRIVGSKILAAAKEDGPIGSKAMRQYCATAILKKSPTPQEAMRRIGGSASMARRHYQDQREHAFEKLEEKRMLLASSSSSGSSSSDSSSSEEDSEDGDPADGSPCTDSGDSDSEDDKKKKRPKGKLTPGMKAKKSRRRKSSSSSSDGRNIVGYSDSESSAEEPERPKGKASKQEEARHSSSGSESGTITPAAPLPDARLTPPEGEVPVEPEAEVPDVSREDLAGTTTPTSE